MSQISPELKNVIITIVTHRVILRAREEERKQQELLRERMILENLVGSQSMMNSGQMNSIDLVNQTSASSKIANPTPRYLNHHVKNLLAYDRDVTTPTLTSIIAPDTTIKDDREENDKTPTRENQEIMSRAKFLQSFRQALISTVCEEEIKQARC